MENHKHNSRKDTRYDTVMPVEFRSGTDVVEAEVANIGAGGMCIKTTAVLPVNTQGFFRIVSKDSSVNFNVEAQVIWSRPQSKIRQRRNKRPGMMGVRFVKSRFITEDTINGILENFNGLQLV